LVKTAKLPKQPEKVVRLSKDEKLELFTQQRKALSLKVALNDMQQRFLQEDAAFGNLVAKFAKDHGVDVQTYRFDVETLDFYLKA
jgi:hypothetical protein